ncbi:pentapeptide repeat-containing protein [Spirulina sp. CS-785/01]|uniref:pentapeptide repeat-containing protein n=1 Tax=Spirulina sp. CS-785/01 TaxID=3021716 RepID=UPI00232B8D19|nr:pentapeptide repeat-containing protein [Spirulina sp. CS-785/01]MDB9312189.1 pentapeptide repeat-containing protein [Spirulina sp. CS-785/01]
MDPLASSITFHPYPDCVRLQLTCIPEAADSHHFTLWLSLYCDQQWMTLLEGRLQFGISRGQLQLQFDDHASLVGDEQLHGEITNAAGETLHIDAQHSDQSAFWCLTPPLEKHLLKGTWEGLKLGTIETDVPLNRLVASLSVPVTGVHLTDAEGLWKHDISPNKHAVLERKLVQFLWKNCFTPNLSYIELRTPEAAKVQPPITSNHPPTPQCPDFRILQEIIDRLAHGKTESFLELLQLAELDPKSDLTGGNLLGTTLNEIDLSGANLREVNLRGAELNDADLSESILSRARLSGADLSGAFLENADLSECNLRRASLALVNLAGVDLSGADLTEANLSNTSWTGANVKGAKFGNNLGLSEELKASLKTQGAIFDE